VARRKHRKKSKSKSKKKKKRKTKRFKPTGHPIVLKRSKRQIGKVKNWELDKKRRALPPGKRISRTGHVYYEYRANRSDKYPSRGI